MSKINRKKYYLWFTLIFIVSVIICYQGYIFTGKSLIFEGDGLSQHYKALIYYSNYLREVFANIFIEHNFIIPQYSFSLGEGSDILGTLHYYVIGDPIAFFSVFVPEDKIYIFYNVTVLLRIYLAGIAFSELCFYKKNNNQIAVVAGSLVYMFCYWTIFTSVRHIYFLNPLIYLPLVILGVERLIEEDKPYFFMLMVMISSLSNFYFFYNIVILTAVYGVVRLLVLYKKDFKSFFMMILKILKYAVMGVLLSGVILVPMLVVFLGDSRLSIASGKHLLYSIDYYKKLPSMFLSTSRVYWLCLGYASPVILSLVYTAKNFKKNKTLSILILIGFIFILFPIFGQLLNGMSYIANKWSFGFSLLVAYDLVVYWDNLKEDSLLLTIIYVLVFVALVILGAHINTIIPLIICGLFVLVIWLDKKDVIKNKKIIQICLCLIVFINVCFTANWEYTDIGTGFSRTATTIEDNANILNEGRSKTIAEYMEDEEFARFAGNELLNNETVLFNAHGTDLYWSLTNPDVSEYRIDLGLGEYRLFIYNGYDERATLYSLANVKYFINEEGDSKVPYGYSLVDTVDGYDIYENEYTLPFGYTYEATYSYSDWLNLNSEEKEEVLRKYLVVDNDENTSLTTSSKDLSYTIEYNDKVEKSDNGFKVNEAGASLTIKLNDKCLDNLYLSFDNVVYDEGKGWLHGTNSATSFSAINNNGYEVSLDLYTEDDRRYNARTDFTLYFGYDNLDTNSITLTFADKGYYSFDGLTIYTVNNDSYIEDMTKLQNSDALENVEFSTNTVSGSIDCKKAEYLLLSIPYGDGWKAYVDNEEVEILKGNVSYSALYLSEGSHDIKLVYETPYLKLGVAVLIVGLALVVGDIVYQRKKRKYVK